MPSQETDQLRPEDITEAASEFAGVIAYARGLTPLPSLPTQENRGALSSYHQAAKNFIEACLTAVQDTQIASLLFTDNANPNELIIAGGGNHIQAVWLAIVRRSDNAPRLCIIAEGLSHDGKLTLEAKFRESIGTDFPEFPIDSWEGPSIDHTGLSGQGGQGWGHNRYLHYLEQDEVIKNPIHLRAFVEGIGSLSKSMREKVLQGIAPVDDVPKLQDIAQEFSQASTRIMSLLHTNPVQ